jgi:site-specific DNA-methyltransferase (adenine-specific)
MDWETPDELFKKLNDEFHFTLDVCANKSNHKCERYFTEQDDALLQEWHGVCWMNPPYGRSIKYWMKKAYQESQRGATVVCLVFARVDTAWFHEWVYGKAEIRFLRGRVRFKGAKSSAPFPSMIVIYKQKLTS